MQTEVPDAFLRLFVAIAVPAAVREEIARAQGQLRRCAPPGAIRWAAAGQFHLTLKFLGDITSGQIAELRDPVARICAVFPALQLSASGVGFFPNAHKPRVIWAGVGDESGRLAELQRQLDVAMRPFAPTDKPERFVAHVTLGRVKPGHHGSLKPVCDRVSRFHNCHFGSWLAEEVIVYRSFLTSERAVHEPYHVCRLTA